MAKYTISDRMSAVTGSAIREIFKLLADPSIISLAGGNPSPATFDDALLAGLAQEILLTNGKSVLQYGATEGLLPMRESALALTQKKGIHAALENIITLTGSSQGIELATKVLLNDGDVILVENPTFLGALQTFRTYQAVPVGVDMDDQGLDLGDLEAKIIANKAKLLYVIPTFQNPSGKTMSVPRRKAVLALCQKHDVMILEDDPYGELRFEGESLPNLKQLDEDERVILLNSFSKTVSPGLRVGYVVADAPIVRKMTIAKQGMDCHTSNLTQAMVDQLIRSGGYTAHVDDIIRQYRVKRDAMHSALQTYFPTARYTTPSGGLFFWLELQNIDATAAFEKAVQSKVAYVPGTHFYADGGHHSTLRLNFSMPTTQQIHLAVQKLAEVLA